MLSRVVANIFLGCLVVVALLSSTDAAVRKLKNGNISASSRVVGGVAIPIENAPYAVQIRENNLPTCGGTLISLQHILTAAHCIDQAALKKTTVVAGATLVTEAGVARKIAHAVTHSKYTTKPVAYDVAIIKLATPFTETDKIKPLTKFSNAAPAVGDMIRASGWGATRRVFKTDELTEDDFPEELYQVRLPVISDADCRKKMNIPASRNTDDRICTYLKGADVCEGDSGGPAVCGDKLCGVISWGIGCASGLPGVFTAAHAIRDFIDERLQA